MIDELLVPGTLIYALKQMKAWENIEERTRQNGWIYPGTLVIVLTHTTVGQHYRLSVIQGDSVMMFSSRFENLRLNWCVPAAQ